MAQLLEVARAIFVRRGYRATTMDEVAAAAGVTKRTLYAWHRDKEALFRACVLLGAERFPRLEPDAAGDPADALERYVVELHDELTREDSFGMGALFLREATDFPELAGSIQRGHLDYMIAPLAAFLRRHALEEEGSVERTMLFVAMALSPLHNAMLVGMALPTPAEVLAHARRCVGIFVGGSRDG
ncbi:MAG: TetR/AcrR family transcriptional regulator [Sphingomonadales bacterium]|nr:TetR/AcrR family transcriptional regulator [Sphingomonadales bacterium]